MSRPGFTLVSDAHVKAHMLKSGKTKVKASTVVKRHFITPYGTGSVWIRKDHTYIIWYSDPWHNTALYPVDKTKVKTKGKAP